MNPNRQNNRCVTPAGSGFVGRPGGRPVGTAGCVTVCADPVPVNTCTGVIGVANNCGNPCNDDCDGTTVIGSIILGQGNAGCNRETMINGMPLAMAYVPWQSYGNVYNLQLALQRGTMFQELDLDFAGRRCN